MSAATITLGDTALPIELRRHPRATRLTMRLAPDGTAVRITLPRWCPARDAMRFAEARAGWLAHQLTLVPEASDPIEGGGVSYCGDRLPVVWRADAGRRVVRQAGGLVVGGPREGAKARLQRWLEGEAATLFAADVAEYCARAGLPVPGVCITRARRRWGSCSDKGIIRLNWRLVQAPPPVRRSVAAHEVAHLVHFDHGPGFRALLRDLFEGDLAHADAWLRRHGRTLYASFG